jgi:phosphoribosylformylglycinamidine synthase
VAKKTFAALHKAIDSGLVRACHDLSEGGLAVAAAEMAFAGGWGARVLLGQVPNDIEVDEVSTRRLAKLAKSMPGEELHPLAAYPPATSVLLFSESNTRFLCEVTQENAKAFKAALGDVPCAMIGEVTDTGKLEIVGLTQAIADADSNAAEIGTPIVVEAEIGELKEVWQMPLDW